MSIKKHILIIDDNVGLCHSLRNIFEDEGHRVTIAHTGADGLAALRKGICPEADGASVVEGPVDVTLLDIRLPDAQGTELLPVIHELQPDMPVIVITAYASLETAVQALHLGAFAYILKPLNMDEVLVTVQHALEKLRLVQQERRSTEQLRALNQAALTITAELEPDRVMQIIADLARELVGAARVALGVPGEDGSLARLYAVGLAEEERAALGDLPRCRGLMNYLLRQVESTRLDDLRQHPQFTGLPPYHPAVTSFLGVPIVSRGRVLGTLYLADKADRLRPGSVEPFTEEDQQVIETLAAQAAVAIENAQLYEAERQWAAELAREVERLRSELIANVSHELRTPLGLIKIFVTSLLKEKAGFNSETRKQFLQSIEEETNKLEEIAANLLEMSRTEGRRLHLDKRPADLAELARKAVEATQAQSVPHRFVCEFPSDPLVATVDARRIEQVLRNLLDNAVKYSPEGRTITIRGYQTEKQVYICVNDEGIGIPAKEQERIFERFYRVDSEVTRRTRGGGLGLAVCRGIVEAHGGRIWVESTLGQGSAFYFTFPYSQGS